MRSCSVATTANRLLLVFVVIAVPYLVFNTPASAVVKRGVAPNTILATDPGSVAAANASVSQPDAPYRGGVFASGFAIFLDGDADTSTPISALNLSLHVTKPGQVNNGSVEYDTYAIARDGISYDLDVDDEVFTRLIRVVDRGASNLFTIPPLPDENGARTELTAVGMKEHFLKNGDEKVSVYMANEFDKSYIDFMLGVDIATRVEPLDGELEYSILRSLETPKVRDFYIHDGGYVASYINADFHVHYNVFLPKNGGAVTIEGTPLRYNWVLLADKSVRYTGVKAFSDYAKKRDLQYRSIELFQSTAVLRQFRKDNPAAYKSLSQDVSRISGSR